jgi:tetratricopeptide (TPR) repeat protein
MNRIVLGLFGLLLLLSSIARAADDLDAQGDLKKSRKDFKGAEAEYTQAITENPRDVRAYISRGIVRDREGNFPGAIADDTAAIGCDPKNAAAYCNRGNARASKRDFGGAIADYNRALALDPRHVRAFINRGNVENLTKNYTAAIADYNAALALDPKNALVFYNRAAAKRANDDLAGAMADHSQAIALNPADARAWLNRAVLKMAERNWNGATDDLQHCLRLIPHDEQAYPRIYLWVIETKQGDEPKATRDLRHYMEEVSKDRDATWPWQIENFCVGRESETLFFTLAARSQGKRAHGQVAQSCYYAGLKKALAGDPAAAAEFFRKCVAKGDLTLHEVVLAREELKSSGGHSP